METPALRLALACSPMPQQNPASRRPREPRTSPTSATRRTRQAPPESGRAEAEPACSARDPADSEQTLPGRAGPSEPEPALAALARLIGRLAAREALNPRTKADPAIPDLINVVAVESAAPAPTRGSALR